MKRLLLLSTFLLVFSVSVYADIFSPYGLWEFSSDDPNTATVGTDLKLAGTVGIISDTNDISGIIEIGEGSYFTLTHGISPNGDGEMVNECR